MKHIREVIPLGLPVDPLVAMGLVPPPVYQDHAMAVVPLGLSRLEEESLGLADSRKAPVRDRKALRAGIRRERAADHKPTHRDKRFVVQRDRALVRERLVVHERALVRERLSLTRSVASAMESALHCEKPEPSGITSRHRDCTTGLWCAVYAVGGRFVGTGELLGYACTKQAVLKLSVVAEMAGALCVSLHCGDLSGAVPFGHIREALLYTRLG